MYHDSTTTVAPATGFAAEYTSDASQLHHIESSEAQILSYPDIFQIANNMLKHRDEFRSPMHLNWLHEQYNIVTKNMDKWSVKEDEALRECVSQFGTNTWNLITSVVPHRSAETCQKRWKVFQNGGTNIKGIWDNNSGVQLALLVHIFGAERWPVIASYVPGRNAKQCREHFINQLDPTIQKKAWSYDEEELIWDLQATLGNKWSMMRAHLPGRTSNMIKNHWHSFMKRRKKSELGIKPESSKPIEPFPVSGTVLPVSGFLLLPPKYSTAPQMLISDVSIQGLEDAEVLTLLLDL